MKNTILLSSALLLGAAATAAVILPKESAPADYGTLRSRNITSVMKAPAAKKGPQKVMAFADAGNAEVDKYGELITLVSEDFSLLTTGSEENPDYDTALELPSSDPSYEYPWNNMQPQYVHGDLRWGVGNAFPAGGMLCFSFDEMNPEAHIVPPLLDLSVNGGAFVVEFRAKVSKPVSQATPFILAVQAAETNNWGPSWDNIDEDFVTDELTTDWRTFRIVFQGGGPTSIINIVGSGRDGLMFIDDVKVYSLKPFVKTPVLARHSGFAADSFNINWHPVEGATKYLVNVWSALPGMADLTKIITDREVAASDTTFKVTDADATKVYYFSVSAADDAHTSLAPLMREVFDIVTPVLKKAEPVGDDGLTFAGKVENQPEAFGFNYTAMAKRVADADGPFTITNEEFTGWRSSLLDSDDKYKGQEFTKENPFLDGVIGGPFYPTDIKQQGWYGKNYMTYKDYLMLAPFYYTASGDPKEQACWVSPEFDLSADGGKVSVDLKLAATYWQDYRRYADCAVALFNYNPAIGDFEQVDLVYVRDLNFDWKDAHIELNGASEISRIGIFALNSYEDMYVDDIVIKQNRKAGDAFMDPFYYSTWQLAEVMENPNEFVFKVPDYASGKEVYNKAQAVRMHLNAYGEYDSEVVSKATDDEYVGKTDSYSGVTLVENDLLARVAVSSGCITVSNPDGEEVVIVSADGCAVNLGNAATVSHTPGAPGIYVVCVGNKSIKVLI